MEGFLTKHIYATLLNICCITHMLQGIIHTYQPCVAVFTSDALCTMLVIGIMIAVM